MKSLYIHLLAGAVGCALAAQFSADAAAKTKETVLYSFSADTYPEASMIDVKGSLYGTTYGPDGSVFVLNPKTGAEKVLYSFCSQYGCSDGEYPRGDLIDVNGTLYGTTQFGGSYSWGTVFALDRKTGAETVLHSFGAYPDGMVPWAGLINVNGTLYGTTSQGSSSGCGGSGCGTVFSLDPSTGAEKVLYSFAGGTDGYFPRANLIAVNGALYGTTVDGGSDGCEGYGCGTVFSLDTTTGAERVLYSFCSRENCADGQNPYASLIDVNGTLYGTTNGGGTNCQSSGGCGTLFALDPTTGAETVVYSFCSQKNCADGQNPDASLISVKGKLYSTTEQGGTGSCTFGCGTVFAVDANTDSETVLYRFQPSGRNTDGVWPIAGPIDVEDTLYGTTYGGGTYGGGTVFRLTKW